MVVRGRHPGQGAFLRHFGRFANLDFCSLKPCADPNKSGKHHKFVTKSPEIKLPPSQSASPSNELKPPNFGQIM